MDTSRISPTAHYTGMVWVKNGLSHPVLSAALQPGLHRLASPLTTALRAFSGGLSLDGALLQRHLALDGLLGHAIEQQGVRQVIEIAAGLSARGLRFSQRYAGLELRYIEGDLPAMVARKQAALDSASLRGPRHEVRVLNALLDAGPESLAEVAGSLDPSLPTAVITEGLLNYFTTEQSLGLWGRVSAALTRFPRGVYLFDLLSRDSMRQLPVARAFFATLGLLVRGSVNLHFDAPAEAEQALRARGFEAVTLHEPQDLPGDLPRGRAVLQRFGEAWRGPRA